jgi:hypothetical protein
MKKISFGLLALWSLASLAGAATIRDWSAIDFGKNVGIYSDKDGTKLEVSQVSGQKDEEKAVQLSGNMVGWGGFWATAQGDLSHAGAIKFMAKASKPMALNLGIADKKKVGYSVNVRILSDDWQEFVVPLSLFSRSKYQAEGAPAKGAIDWSKVASMTFSPAAQGDFTLALGSIASQSGKAEAKIGIKAKPGVLVVQDFTLLEKNAYGPYSDDKGTSITMTLKKDPQGDGNQLADFHYDIKEGGWCGYWMRAGESWGGQDWRGALSMNLEVYSEEPIQLNMGFNDPNQCAYVADSPKTKGKGWETLTIPFKNFALNKYYQPEGAKKGAALDLSHIESINLSPKGDGKHEFQVREIDIKK